MSAFWMAENLRTTELVPMPAPPWELANPRPDGLTKSAYRKWCGDSGSRGVFFTGVEFADPSCRGSKERGNLPRLLHAFVADYDCCVDNPAQILRDAAARLEVSAPSWVGKTFSGGARVVWLFDRPVPVDNEELSKALMGVLSDDLLAARLMPGFDRNSLNLFNLWEAGSNWEEVGGSPLNGEWFFYRAAGKAKLGGGGQVTIPLADVAEEVERRWPGKWRDVFEAGSRGPLFWIDDGITRDGCMVVDEGVVCFSTRAGKTFLSWGDLLGGRFVSQFMERKFDRTLTNVFYLENRYWLLAVDGTWIDVPESGMKLELRNSGYSNQQRKAGLSELDAAILHLMKHRRALGAAPFLFSREKVVRYGGGTYLNTSVNAPMAATGTGDPSEWPWVHEFLWRFFDPDSEQPDVRPLDVFLAWLQRFWKSIRGGSLSQGQAVVIAGENDTGKGLLGNGILGRIAGRAMDASGYLVGQEPFNSALADVPLWTVEDAIAGADFRSRRRFTELVKRHVASSTFVRKKKFSDDVEVPWTGRIYVSANLDMDSLQALPDLDGTVLDKMLVFKVSPICFRDFPPYAEIGDILDTEAPRFLTWLDKWVPPAAVSKCSPRFGVAPFHHSDIVRKVRLQSPDHHMEDILEQWVMEAYPEGGTWRGSASDLLRELAASPGLSVFVRNDTVVGVGRKLTKLAEQPNNRVSCFVNRGRVCYQIDLTPQ